MYVGFAGAAGPSANADELTPWRSKTPRSPDCCTGRGFFLHGLSHPIAGREGLKAR